MKSIRKLVKNKDAVTLIALVVTIIVLIILSVVIINLVFRDQGLFSKAKYGKESYATAEKAEQVGLLEHVNNMDSEIDASRNSNYDDLLRRIEAL